MKIIVALFYSTLLLFTSLYSAYAEETGSANSNAIKVIEETKSSERWKYIGETKHGYVGFMDINRFQVDGPNRNAWTKVIYTEGELFKNGKGEEYTAVYTITNRNYDCYNKRVSDIKSVDYDADGNSYTTDFEKLYRAYPEKKWIDIIPGSLGEYLLKFVCSYQS